MAIPATDRRAFTLVELLVVVGLLGILGGVGGALASGGLTAVRAAWVRAEDTREADRLIARFGEDTRGASLVQGIDAALVEFVSAPGALVRYRSVADAAGVEVWRDVRSGVGPWTSDPMRPIARFAARSGSAAPSVVFSSPGAGGAGVRVETDVLLVEGAAYSRFE
jgi:prepilin-type N-terminal cleavage/methylation domain-containing protein